MLELKPAARKHAPPSTRWRNYYRIYRVLNLWRLGTVFPGIHGGPDVFPSKEVAEHQAQIFLKLLNPPGRYIMDHVGAFPEGDAAN